MVEIPNYTSLGCWKDTAERAIDGGHEPLPGSNPVQACFERARSLGNSVFAVQAGNQCFAASSTAGDTYKKYGPATNCANGRGGGWANSVYHGGIEKFYSIKFLHNCTIKQC